MLWFSRVRAHKTCLLLLGLGVAGCENKCDELVSVLTDCVGGDVGAEETEETDDPTGDTECSGDDETCATCILEKKVDLCTEYGVALAQCRADGECE